MLIQLRAFAEALFSTDEGPPPSQRMDWLMTEMADFLNRSGPAARFIFRLSLLAITFVAPLLVGRLATLPSLTVAQRVDALNRMEESFAAAPVLAVKAFLCVTYYEHPDVQREVGHVGLSTFPMQVRP